MSIFLVSIVNASGLGVAPATLKFENALKGATTEKELSIQNPGDEPITVEVNIDGEISDWITLSPQTVNIPAKDSVKVIVKLAPPVEKPDGEYTAKVLVRAKSTSEIEGSGMGLLPGIDTDIIATITDEEIVSGKVTKILTKDEEYGVPVKFTIGFGNHGNVPVGPDVKIEIEKRGTGIIDTVEQSLEKIKPGASKDYEVSMQTTGKEKNVYYRATVTVFLDNEIIEKKENIGFRILESSKEISSKVEETNQQMFYGIFVTLIIIIIGLAIYSVIYFIKRK